MFNSCPHDGRFRPVAFDKRFNRIDQLFAVGVQQVPDDVMMLVCLVLPETLQRHILDQAQSMLDLRLLVQPL